MPVSFFSAQQVSHFKEHNRVFITLTIVL